MAIEYTRFAIDAIIETARANHSVNYPRAIAAEAIQLKQSADYWRDRCLRAESDQSAGYMRRVGHPSAPQEAPPAETDDWIQTGKE